ncbi:hypothetical protein NQ176_g4398 [Zarea fungicola]|uniref:Uncharacterized protein n=1 Tax=Zarea fungicola TaxID=93591 RepID=A0ACC1NDJ8_9HYPO|nr:hypothetical protein NQ176_g4398 [Lecanicillium fungicola]
MVTENRSFDNLLGGQTLTGLGNPIQTGPYCNPLNVSRPDSGTGCIAALDFDSIIDDPDHSVSGNNLEFYGSFTPDNEAIRAFTLQPNMDDSLTEQIRLIQVLVITALTQNFVVFNHWHSETPGPTLPNRVSLCSGTSAGKGQNDIGYNTMEQKSIFQQATELGFEWKDHLVDTSIQDARWFKWTGKLPHLAYINSSCSSDGTNSMHPADRVFYGEQLIKYVYEAVRRTPADLARVTVGQGRGGAARAQTRTAGRPDGVVPGHVNFTDAGLSLGVAPYNPRASGTFDHLIGTTLRTDTPEKFPTVSHFRS